VQANIAIYSNSELRYWMLCLSLNCSGCVSDETSVMCLGALKLLGPVVAWLLCHTYMLTVCN